ncbi:uncharacterized protein [Physcomitrium patens]|uniref:Thioredoxin domain-containing protein n=1 Tax=Physcomitrium patens TaxID=3218 RepID=A9RLH1_PHYPA|nr:thioredoxin domain-containing protein-like [Physcomitrium patens]XP_024398758.1 thioredoxin domain-containing protein-like [Physcomitrium patens]PNR37398.1 hypothetical protein PHYPA_020507 [Physcomitrium patens]|eukprot:XP_024398757.1 thioredoxin domain-containing protein-like [Physcomitrella patens]
MKANVWRRVLLLLLVLPTLAVFADRDDDDFGLEGEAPRELLMLSDRNFEHDTQAATGQTTGAWVVLFLDRQCEKCTISEKALLEAATEQQPIAAQVNVLQSPKLRKRFSLTSVPALRLFRDRRMFIYKGDWNAASISAFIKSGWKETEALEVPPEASGLSDLLDDIKNSFHPTVEYLGRRPGLMIALGGFFATTTYALTLKVLGLTTKKKPTRTVKKRAD